MKRILHITPDFNYSCGRSRLVFLYLKYFGSKDDCQTHFITNGGDSLERLEEIPLVKFKSLSFTTGFKNIIYYKSFYNSLKRYIEENKIDLIHTHHRFPELVSVKLAEEQDIKTITSAHSFVKGFRNLSFTSDKIISVSNSLTTYLEKNFAVDNRITTLYNPVEEITENKTKLNELRKKLSLYPEQKIILFMGKINYEKGFDKLIEAYKLVKMKIKSATLIACGKIEEKDFQKLRNKLKDPVLVIPPLNGNMFLYHICNLVVLPSKVESLSNIMLEAGINKKPFIGSNTGGIAEFIEDGVNGYLINPEDENEIAEKIIYLLNNKETADKLAKNLYEKVKDKCDYQNYFSRVEKIYDSLLSGK